MKPEIAKHNATILYESLTKDPNAEFTYSKDGKIKRLGFLGRVWEKITHRFSKGSAKKKRIEAVGTLAQETLMTLRKEANGKFPASSALFKWFRGKDVTDRMLANTMAASESDTLNRAARTFNAHFPD